MHRTMRGAVREATGAPVGSSQGPVWLLVGACRCAAKPVVRVRPFELRHFPAARSAGMFRRIRENGVGIGRRWTRVDEKDPDHIGTWAVVFGLFKRTYPAATPPGPRRQPRSAYSSPLQETSRSVPKGGLAGSRSSRLPISTRSRLPATRCLEQHLYVRLHSCGEVLPRARPS